VDPKYRFLDASAGPITLVDLLRQRAECQADDRAYTFLVDGESEEVHLTYRELDRQARAIGAWLSSQGLKGQRALLLYPPGLDFIAAFFGCQYADVIAVPVYPPRMNRAPSRIQAIAADAGATVALTTDAVLERVRPLIDQTPDLKGLRWLSTDRTAHGADQGYEEQWQPPQITGDTLAFLQYTSGSTGTPKGVVLSHSNLLHNSALIAYAFEHTRSASGVFWLPSYHDMGLVGGILQPLYVGRPNILMSPVAFLQKPVRWLQAISRYGGTTSGGPNFAFDLCVRKITPNQRATLDLSSWTVAFTGAEPVRAATLEEFAETFAPCGFRPEAFYPCYGLAEATLLVSGGYKTAPPIVRWFDGKSLEGDRAVPIAAGEGGTRPLVGCGQTMPDQQIVIADPNRLARMPAGQVGEVWVSGPSVAKGYWRRSDETEQTFRAYLEDTGEGPFLRTGDLGFTHDGELFVTGRLKDLVIVRGENHYPQDIEATAARSHPGVRDGLGAAFTVDEGAEQRLVIILELERRQRAEAPQVIEAIRRDVAGEHELLVDSIVFVRAGSIPKTSSGKIQRHVCRDAFLDRRLDVLAEWHRAGSDGRRLGEAADPHRPQPARRPSTSHRSRAEARWQTLEATAEIVLDVVRSIGKDRTVGLELDSPIAELGLDSLERMEIVAALEEHFGGRLPDQVVAEMYTCREVIDAVQKHLVNGRDGSRASRAVEIPPEDHHFDRYPEYVKLKQNLEMLESTGLGNPFFKIHERVANDTTVIGGREMINFSSYNYVGMSGDPVVAAAAKDAIDRYGTSVSASRLVSGETGLHRELEGAIADFLGADDAIVFVGGHSTNETTVGHLFGPGDLILHDALAHNSIVQGCILSGAHRRPARGLSPRPGGHRGRLQHGRRYPGPAAIHRSEEAPQGLPHGRRGPLSRRPGTPRPRHRRILRRGSPERRPVDGHPEQVVRQLRRIHCRVSGNGRVSEVHGAGLRVQRRNLAGQRRRRPGGDPAGEGGARAGCPASRTGRTVPDAGSVAGIEHRSEQGFTDRAGDPGGLRALLAAVAGDVRPRDQRPADSLSRRRRAGGAAAILHHRQPHGSANPPLDRRDGRRGRTNQPEIPGPGWTASRVGHRREAAR
jgi:acyl carrier protein